MVDFDKVFDNLGTAEDLINFKPFIKSDELKQKVVDFIKANKIDCSHLWEDGEEGNKSTKDWHKLVEFVLPFLPDKK